MDWEAIVNGVTEILSSRGFTVAEVTSAVTGAFCILMAYHKGMKMLRRIGMVLLIVGIVALLGGSLA